MSRVDGPRPTPRARAADAAAEAREVAPLGEAEIARDVDEIVAASGAASTPPPAGVVPAREIAGVSDARWGAFLGRLLSRTPTDAEAAALDGLFASGRRDEQLHLAMSMNGQFTSPAARAHIERVAAGVALAKRAMYGKLDDEDKAAVAVLAASDPSPITGHPRPLGLLDGDLEGVLFKWIRVNVPGLTRQILDNHPLIATKEQLVATNAVADEIAHEQGKVLSGFNVMTVMHQLGSTPGWLDLLADKLGLSKDDYLGVSVPYSGSEVAIEKLNRDGWTTLDDHDPRPQALQMLMRAMGRGDRKSFDERKEAAVTRAVEKMLEKAEQNHKPILVIDDGGYVSKVVHEKFPAHADKFRLVEWTTRGITQFEKLKDPKLTLVSGAESRPKKELEPAFIADAVVDNLEAALVEEVGPLKGKRVCVVGNGAIGNAAARALAALGARVTVTDGDRQKLKLDRDEKKLGMKAERDVKRAVAGQDIVIGATGKNSMPPEVFRETSPDTVVASISSVDIETRNDRAPEHGRWGVADARITVRVSNDAPDRSPRRRGSGRPRRGHPISNAGRDALEANIRARLPAGMQVGTEERRVLNGGYPINLNRRLRLMDLDREELVLMNVTEAIAQAAAEDEPGKHALAAEREQRIERVFSKTHPAAYARATR